MSVPNFQDFMLPLMLIAAERKNTPFQSKDIVELIIQRMKLTAEDLSELFPGTTIPKYTNRLRWALQYLYQAGLLERVKRATYRISQRGLKAVQSKPARIDTNFLQQYPEYVAFQKRSKSNTDRKQTANECQTPNELNPDEQMVQAFEEIQASLAQEILSRLMNSSPAFFERLVVELLVKMGYGGSFEDAAKAIGKSHDGGIDGIIKEDRLGLDAIYIQAKRYTGKSVGIEQIHQFVGALAGHHAGKGVLLTTSSFTKSAVEYVKTTSTAKVILIDGETLVRYMIEYNLGVSIRNTFLIKKIDEDYFEEE